MRSTDRLTRIVAVFESARDGRRVAPAARPVAGHAPVVAIEPAFVAKRALAGALALGVVACGAVAAVQAARGVFGVASPAELVAALGGAVVGAALGVVVARRGARAVESELARQRRRGLVPVVLEASEDRAAETARELERSGALEAAVLPRGLRVETTADLVAWVERIRPRGESSGATLVAGNPLIASAVRHVAGEDVRIAVFGRAGAGDWWRPLATEGAPRRIAFVDAEVVVVGELADFLARELSLHANDALSSAVARLAEMAGCPDESARVVSAALDEGCVGVLIVGKREARRRAIELLSFTATAVSEGVAPLDADLAPESRAA